MKTKYILLIVLGAILLFIAIVVISGISSYNKMVKIDENINNAWAQVENVYQRRADLIPNLVNTVKGYAEHERETLMGVTEARSKVSQMNVNPENLTPQALQQFQQAQDGLSQALSRLMVVVERYPDLKANQNFLNLQAQLEGTENRITVERMKFNEAVKTYNSYIRLFPRKIWAGMFGFEKKPYFEADEGAEKVPEVQF